jgi:oxalate/formate antiporter
MLNADTEASFSAPDSRPTARRWPLLWLGIVCMILIANLQYGWTLFVNPIHKAHGWAVQDIQTAFVIFVAVETWATPFQGWIVDHLGPIRGPKLMVALGGVLVAAGWAVNAGAVSLMQLFEGAALSGLGAGAIYATCVGNAVKWFPDRRGLAVGATAAGFGAGAALTVVPIRMLIAGVGYQRTFLWIGLGQGAVLLLLALFIRSPLPGEVAAPSSTARQSAVNASPGEVLRSPVFWLLYVMFLLIATTGLLLTAQIAPIAKDFGLANANLALGATVLSTALVVDNVMNGLARPVFGAISDRIGRENTMALAFTIGGASYGLLVLFGHSPWGFVICAGLAFFTFGEIFSLFPSTCTDLFGPRYATANASLLYTAKGTAALLMQAADKTLAASGNWRTVFLAAAVSNIVVAATALLILRPIRAARHRAEAAARAAAEPPVSIQELWASARDLPYERRADAQQADERWGAELEATIGHPVQAGAHAMEAGGGGDVMTLPAGPDTAQQPAESVAKLHQPADTILQLLSRGADDAPAIGAPGRAWLTHGALRALAHRTISQLNAFGIGCGDRVAIVLPNGPEMASAFVSIACGAVTAPLNPAYQAEEFHFYLTDLRASALVVQRGTDTPARKIAAGLRIPILELVVDADAPAGAFTLEPLAPLAGTATVPGAAAPGDTALVLHTSGTTSRPKIVPLSHINVTASAYNIAGSLRLTPDDLCLNIMPLFHIHGLIAATLASLSAGAAVCCTPGFNAFKFFGWLDAVRPTWYTAVPTMHQAILQLAGRNASVIKAGRLRFLRSSSASLPAPVMETLEDVFGVPVIEAYGMTEAAHQMASNPLPPLPRYPGSVGVAAGPEIAIMDADGHLLPADSLGEVVIRGRNVTAGYENNPKANAENFMNGWFRTGDQGTLDADGYLRLTGRLKELINRGGEKISPLEVDGVLMEHPAVAQCLTFAMPHTMLGEDVAAAIVLREGMSAADHELRDYAATRLAQFKVPRKIVFLEEIPKGATGKLQRIGLAEKLGLV